MKTVWEASERGRKGYVGERSENSNMSGVKNRKRITFV